MRAMLAMITLSALVGFAPSETINVQTTGGFGNLHQYHDAMTDVPGLTVTMYLPQSGVTGGMTLWFSDQVNPENESFYSYYIGTYNGSGNISVLEKCVFVDMYSCVRNGEMLAVTIDETSVRRQINSGRLHAWVTHWTLQDGVVVR